MSEGIEKVSERQNRTIRPIRPMHFVDEKFNGKQLWESVEGYISKAYDTEALKHIYVHGDGGKRKVRSVMYSPNDSAGIRWDGAGKDWRN